MPSSVIESFHYNPESRTLRVNFLSGTIYDYYQVPEWIFVKMNSYKSKGTFLNRFIKGNFDYSRVDPS